MFIIGKNEIRPMIIHNDESIFMPEIVTDTASCASKVH